jgi:hypothetical protein
MHLNGSDCLLIHDDSLLYDLNEKWTLSGSGIHPLGVSGVGKRRE